MLLRLRGLSRGSGRPLGVGLCRGTAGQRCLLRGGLGVFLCHVAQIKAALPAAGGSQGCTHRAVDRIKHIAFPRKTDLGFGGVYVDVHQVRRHINAQDGARVFALHQGTLVSVFQRSHHGAVFDIAAIDVKMLRTARRPAGARRGNKAGHFINAAIAIQRQQVAGKLPPQHRIGSAAQLTIAGGHELLLAVPQKAECNFRVGQRFVQNDIRHKSSLTDVLFQELHAGGRIIEQIVHRYGGAARAGAGLHALGLAALNAIAAGVFVRFGAGQHLYPGHAGDGSKRFAAEAKGLDVAQILGTGNFAGCVAHKGFINILCLNAAAVIRNLQLLNAAAHDGERDLRCTGVDGVFQQFLCNRSRPLHHLACGDQFSGMLIQYANFCHGVPLSRSGSVFLLKV